MHALQQRKTALFLYLKYNRKGAVKHYRGHGRCLAATQRALGYPASRDDLGAWIDEYTPGQRYHNPNWRGPAKGYKEGLKIAVATVQKAGVADTKDVSSATGAWRGPCRVCMTLLYTCCRI